MRKLNVIISHLILVLFIVHGVLGAMTLTGVGHISPKWIAWTMVALILVHAVIGTIMTVQSLYSMKKTGAPYFKENSLFWARRISGFAVMLFILLHVTAFSYHTYGVYRLKRFTAGKLAVQLMLLLSVAVHIISNIRPLLIGSGVKSLKERAGDILLFLSLLLLFMAAAFIIYYVRWNVL